MIHYELTTGFNGLRDALVAYAKTAAQPKE